VVSERRVIDEFGVRWDRVMAIEPRTNPTGDQHVIAIAGLVDGEDGGLLLRVPGFLPVDYFLGGAEARALLAALVARVSPLPDDLMWRKPPVHVQIAGGYVETTYADGTSSVEPEFDEDAADWGDDPADGAGGDGDGPA